MPYFTINQESVEESVPAGTELDSLFFLPTSPMMSHESTTNTTAPLPTTGNLYSALHAVTTQQHQQTAPSNPRLSVFDMAASPQLTTMTDMNHLNDFCLSPRLDGFLMGGLSTDSPRTANYSFASPTMSRVSKVPMRRTRQGSPRFNSPKFRQMSLQGTMMLPCQFDPKTNKTSPRPDCPELLLASPPSSASSATSPHTLPMFANSTLLGGFHHPPNMSMWMANFAAHRAAFLQDYSKIDFENVTVVELKALLRKYGVARAGKKVELEDRLRQIAAFLEKQIAREKGGVEESTANVEMEQKALDDKAVQEASVYINA